jgi:hypothetical protein
VDITSLKAWEMKEKLLNKEISSKDIVEAHIKKHIINHLEDEIEPFKHKYSIYKDVL